MTLLITDGFPRNLGYVEIDQRASGIPVAGAPVGSAHLEADTYTCSHCQFVVARLVIFDKSKREPTKCKGCNHHICNGCAAKQHAGEPCKTWAQQVDEMAERVARQLGTPSILPLTKGK